MNALSGAAIFVVQTLVSLYLVIVLLRFVLQLVKANFYNPLCQFAVRATQPLLKPIRRIIPSIGGLDTSSLLLAVIIQALQPNLQDGQLIVSIAAGITCASLQSWVGARPVVRCMPNTPALLRQGVSGLYATAEVSDTQRQQAEQLLSAVGTALWLDQEQQLDAVTAVSGSGPAYFFLLIEAMTAAGEKLGLPRETASQLTLQTALGAARMAVASDVDAAELRRRVTSPAGTTEAAIKSFQASGFEAIVEQALQAAATRSAELAEQLGK